MIEKIFDPKLSRNLLCRALAPRQFRKNQKNVPELVAIFCEKRSETVAKHRVTRSKITLFLLAIPKIAGFWKKRWNFRVFGGFGAFRPPNSAKLFLGQLHYSGLSKKIYPQKQNRPPMGPNLRQTTFYRNRN